MYCNHCGKELDENMKFCPDCGKNQAKENAYSPARELFSEIGKKLKTVQKSILGISITVVIGILLIVLLIPKNAPSQGLEYEFWGENYYVVGIGTCEDTKIVIPSEYNGYPVASISDKAFEDCKQLKQVKIPIGCKTIYDFAFSSCDNLERIDIPNSLTYIGVGCFNGCEKAEVYYDGTSYEWIAISQFSPYIIDDCKVFCTDGVID